MPEPLPVIRKWQIWASRAEPLRRFLVVAVADGEVRGLDYYVNESTTRDKKLSPAVLLDRFTLLKEPPFAAGEAPDVRA